MFFSHLGMNGSLEQFDMNFLVNFLWYELSRGIWLPLDCLNILVLWSYKKYLVILQPNNNLAAISVWKTLQWSGSLKQSWRFKEVEYIPLPTHPSGLESSVYRISSRILFLLKPSVSLFWALSAWQQLWEPPQYISNELSATVDASSWVLQFCKNIALY